MTLKLNFSNNLALETSSKWSGLCSEIFAFAFAYELFCQC